MDSIKQLSKKQYVRSQKRNTLISTKLNNEIKATQILLSKLYQKKYGKKKSFSRIQASDFLAENYRITRYRLQK